MSACPYLYASGLRISSGEGTVAIDGKTYRVVRNGKGKSRLDRPMSDPLSDGEISLKDLAQRLKSSGESTIDLTVRLGDVQFSAPLDPTSAMGRKGRAGDFRAALANMDATSRQAAAEHQLRTLPYSDRSDTTAAKERLAAALEIIDVTESTHFLPPGFALFASSRALNAAIAAAEPKDRLRFATWETPHEMFDADALQEPWQLLKWASERASIEQFREAAHQEPEAFYRYGYDRAREDAPDLILSDSRFSGITDRELQDLFSRAPGASLAGALGVFKDRISDDMITLGVKTAPPLEFFEVFSAHERVRSLTPPEVFKAKFERDPAAAFVARDHLSDEQLDFVCNLARPEDVLYAYAVSSRSLADGRSLGYDRPPADYGLVGRLSASTLEDVMLRGPEEAIEAISAASYYTHHIDEPRPEVMAELVSKAPVHAFCKMYKQLPEELREIAEDGLKDTIMKAATTAPSLERALEDVLSGAGFKVSVVREEQSHYREARLVKVVTDGSMTSKEGWAADASTGYDVFKSDYGSRDVKISDSTWVVSIGVRKTAETEDGGWYEAPEDVIQISLAPNATSGDAFVAARAAVVSLGLTSATV